MALQYRGAALLWSFDIRFELGADDLTGNLAVEYTDRAGVSLFCLKKLVR